MRAIAFHLPQFHPIHGFCYYHYWFNGRRVLERPINEIWKSEEPTSLSVCAGPTKNWTRRWDGLEGSNERIS